MQSRVYFFHIAALCALASLAHAEATPAANPLRAAVDRAVEAVKPALVRIHVVETYYNDGREQKSEASGSGVVITPEGCVITNHHVAGHAKQLKVTFWNKEEREATLVGTDPLTDIAVIKIENPKDEKFAVAKFGDSIKMQVGDNVLAMGSPLALSQSVTLGIISNIEMIMPAWMQRWGGFELDGEDVGSLVKWIGHDAAIYPGNSGGPLVNLDGEIIGINEIDLGLSGAIPGNLAREIAQEVIAKGKITRAWLGIDVQPRFKHAEKTPGVIVGGTIADSPAEKAGFQSGDRLVRLGDKNVDVQFSEQLPEFNRLVAGLPIGQPAEAIVVRAGTETKLQVSPAERPAQQPKEYELKEWGVTVRNVSLLVAKELKRENTDGVLVTSVRPGGPAGEAKPEIQEKDILVSAGGKPVKSVAELEQVTAELIKGATEPKPVLTGFERKTAAFVTMVKVGIKEIEDPGLEVKKAWLPVKTQVITRDIAQGLGKPELTGFRVTQLFKGSTAEKAGLKVGDLILAIDGEKMTASAPENYEELPAFIRQYDVGASAKLHIRRGDEELDVAVELVRAPKLDREMKKYRDERFEFTVRNITFFDKADEQWADDKQGVLVDQVVSGGWAALGALSAGDLLMAIDNQPTPDVDTVQKLLHAAAEQKPKSLVFKVLRGIHTRFIEIEPKWDNHKR